MRRLTLKTIVGQEARVSPKKNTFQEQVHPVVLLTMAFAALTFSYDRFPIGTKKDLPVLPREVTIHDEQQTPRAAQN